jgi:hypothetical protein
MVSYCLEAIRDILPAELVADWRQHPDLQDPGAFDAYKIRDGGRPVWLCDVDCPDGPIRVAVELILWKMATEGGFESTQAFYEHRVSMLVNSKRAQHIPRVDVKQ